MSKSTFEKLLEERGFQANKSKGAINILLERQSLVGKTLITYLDEAGVIPLTEDAVSKATEKLYPRRNVYSTGDKEQLASVNSRPLPEIKNPIGPLIEEQLKYLVSTATIKPVSSSNLRASAVLQEDAGPTTETVFPARKSAKGVDFRFTSDESASAEIESRKRAAFQGTDDNHDDEEKKRIRITGAS